MLVAFDTNVIISALKSAKGASFRLIQLLRAGEIHSAVTAPLVFEYADVASRLELLPHLSPSEISGFLDWFVSVSSHHKVHFLWRPLLRDPKDDMVLEAACAASAGCIVTHNISDFDRASSLGVNILSPLQLLTIISPSSL